MARRNTPRLRSSGVAKSNATSQSTRLLKEKENREEVEEITSSRSEDKYTETTRT